MSRSTPKNSDGSHRRYFRVMEDVLDDADLAEVSGDAFRAFVRLMAHLNRIGSKDGRCVVDKRGLCFIANRSRLDWALATLSQLEACSKLALTQVGPSFELALSKWSELQGTGSRSYSYSDPCPDPKERQASSSLSKPLAFPEESRARLRKWGEGKGFSMRQLAAGMEKFVDWEPLKRRTRTMSQWEAAFKRIVREEIESGRIDPTPESSKPRGLAYSDADELLKRRREEFDAEVERSRPMLKVAPRGSR